MKAKNLHMALLFDFYSGLLTEKQKDVIDLYYNEDLSLSEIGEHMNITRQGVRDDIKRAEDTLIDAEEKIGFLKRVDMVKENTLELKKVIAQIDYLNEEKISSLELEDRTKQLYDIVEEMNAWYLEKGKADV